MVALPLPLLFLDGDLLLLDLFCEPKMPAKSLTETLDLWFLGLLVLVANSLLLLVLLIARGCISITSFDAANIARSGSESGVPAGSVPPDNSVIGASIDNECFSGASVSGDSVACSNSASNGSESFAAAVADCDSGFEVVSGFIFLPVVFSCN